MRIATIRWSGYGLMWWPQDYCWKEGSISESDANRIMNGKHLEDWDAVDVICWIDTHEGDTQGIEDWEAHLCIQQTIASHEDQNDGNGSWYDIRHSSLLIREFDDVEKAFEIHSSCFGGED